MAELDGFPANLRLARQFHGWALQDIAEKVGVTKQYLGFLEGGTKKPTEILLQALGEVLGFDSAHFVQENGECVDHGAYQFRCRRSATMAAKSQFIAHWVMVSRLVAELDQRLSLPAINVSHQTLGLDADPDRVAAAWRRQWGVAPDVPISNLTRRLETAGVVVKRVCLEGGIDALSRRGRRPIILTNTEKDSASRTVWDSIHEWVHIAGHAGLKTDDPAREDQADAITAAFLMPRVGFAREFPRPTHPLFLEWQPLFRLKQRWRVSVAAIVRRASELKLISAAHYRQACKFIRMQGWHRGEPEEFQPEKPELIEGSLAALPQYAGITAAELAIELGWSREVFEDVSGVKLPKTQPIVLERRTQRNEPNH
jgi:Zn-dependent peptidase ImmA (M78 family)/transcriptional regulator with XRE-family HTH domain